MARSKHRVARAAPKPGQAPAKKQGLLGRLKEAVGYSNARVLVLVPDARRREALARLIEQEADQSLASRFWLSRLCGSAAREASSRKSGDCST